MTPSLVWYALIFSKWAPLEIGETAMGKPIPCMLEILFAFMGCSACIALGSIPDAPSSMVATCSRLFDALQNVLVRYVSLSGWEEGLEEVRFWVGNLVFLYFTLGGGFADVSMCSGGSGWKMCS